ncbi:MAG: hypothetical protein AAGA63_09975 [Pseudomonadota bacterium]
MTYVSKIIDAFGGIRPMAARINKPVSTVQSWKLRGSIPDEHKPDIYQASEEDDIGLSKEDFFPTPHNVCEAAE